MGWLRKKAKQLVKGVKKVFKKVGKAFGKLGVLGQIGMMLLMPTFSGALGSFFGKAGKLAEWSSTLLSKSGIGAKALGHGLNMVNKAATFAGKVYTTVTEGISNGLDRVTNFAKGKGFGLSEGKTSIFAKDVATPTAPESLTKILEAEKPFDVTTTSTEDFTKKLMEGKGEFPGVTDVSSMLDTPDLTGFVPEKTLKLDGDLTSFFEQSYQEAITPKIKPSEIVEGLTDVSDFTKPLDVSLLTKPKDVPFMDTIKGIPGEIKKGIQEFDIKESVTTGLEEGAIAGIYKATGQKVAKAAGYETEAPTYNFIDTGNVIDNLLVRPQSYQNMNYSLQQQGNNFNLDNILNSNALNSLVERENAEYQNFMSNFSINQIIESDDFIAQGNA
jgi:hypothetical protein